MSLADYYDEGKYFKPGSYPMTVKGTRFFTYNTGSPGVEFVCGDGTRELKAGFCLVEKALWKLADFAKACGISIQQMRAIDPSNQNSFRVFVGKSFRGIVGKTEPNAQGKCYSELVDWEELSGPAAKAMQAAAPPTPAPAAPPTEDPYTTPGYTDQVEEPAMPVADDIPF